MEPTNNISSVDDNKSRRLSLRDLKDFNQTSLSVENKSAHEIENPQAPSWGDTLFAGVALPICTIGFIANAPAVISSTTLYGLGVFAAGKLFAITEESGSLQPMIKLSPLIQLTGCFMAAPALGAVALLAGAAKSADVLTHGSILPKDLK